MRALVFVVAAGVCTDAWAQVDLSVTASAPASATPGSTYAVSIGVVVPTSGLTGVTVVFSKPVGTIFAAAQPSDPVGWSCSGNSTSRSCSSNGVVSLGVKTFAFIVDTQSFTGMAVAGATVSCPTNNDPTPGNDSATATTNVASTPTANIGLTVGNGAGPHTAGSSVTYTITASNSGPDPASGALSDAFPLSGVTWSCSATQGAATCPTSGSGDLSGLQVSLPASSSIRVSATGKLPSSSTGTFSNSVSIVLDGGVVNSGMATASDNNDAIAISSEVTIGIDNQASQVTAGSMTTYAIVVANAGPSDAPSVAVSVVVPGTLTAATWTCAGTGSCADAGAGDITDTAQLAANTSVTYRLTGTVTGLSGMHEIVSATATVANDPTTPNLASDDDVIVASTVSDAGSDAGTDAGAGGGGGSDAGTGGGGGSGGGAGGGSAGGAGVGGGTSSTGGGDATGGGGSATGGGGGSGESSGCGCGVRNDGVALLACAVLLATISRRRRRSVLHFDRR